MKTQITTVDELKVLLKAKPLKFFIPKEQSGKTIDLTIVVHPKKEGRENDVYINGIHQRKLFGTLLEKEWYKKSKDRNDWENNFNRNWRYFLNLDLYPTLTDESNFIIKYYITPNNNYRKHTIGKWPKKPLILKPNRPNRVKLCMLPKPKFICVKDLNTGLIERMIKTDAEKLIEKYTYYDYCKKEEWKLQQNSKEFKDLYWSDEEYSYKDSESEEVVCKNNFIPRKKQTPKIKLTYKVVGKQIVSIPKSPKKPKLSPNFDRHAKRQYIKVYPKKDAKPEKQEGYYLIPKYVYIKETYHRGKNDYIFDKDGNPILKKIFVENIKVNVTFYRNPRIVYKTIITKQYPSNLCERRRIVKKNIELLRKQQKEENEKNELLKNNKK